MASCVGSLFFLSSPPSSPSCYPSSSSSASAVVATGLRSRTVQNIVFRTRTSGTRGGSVASSVRGNPTKREVVVPAADYRLPLVLLGLCGGFVYQDNLLVAAPFGLLGLLLLFQTTRVRFVFGEDALEVKIGEELQESGENVFVGGENCWKYSTFVNWEFWWPNFPILVYFKETQTKPEGQVHFFPVIANGKQLYDVMVGRAGSSKTSGPKGSPNK